MELWHIFWNTTKLVKIFIVSVSEFLPKSVIYFLGHLDVLSHLKSMILDFNLMIMRFSFLVHHGVADFWLNYHLWLWCGTYHESIDWLKVILCKYVNTCTWLWLWERWGQYVNICSRLWNLKDWGQRRLIFLLLGKILTLFNLLFDYFCVIKGFLLIILLL